MAQVDFASGGLDSDGRIGQEIVRTMHATLGRGLLVLLNGHLGRSTKKVIGDYIKELADEVQLSSSPSTGRDRS